MAAYVVIKLMVEDPKLLKDYQSVALSIIKKYKGKFLARGGNVITLERPSETRRIIIIEFPNLDDAKAYYQSEEYTNAIELRKSIAVTEIIAVEGW